MRVRYNYFIQSPICFVVRNQSRDHITTKYRTEDLLVDRSEIVTSYFILFLFFQHFWSVISQKNYLTD